jgi:hypothetical protein
MLARPATAGQATFEPEEDDEDLEDDDLEEELLTLSPDFLSPLLDLSPDDEEEEDEDDESELAAALSDFLPSEPFVEAAAGSELFWLVRLSVR